MRFSIKVLGLSASLAIAAILVFKVAASLRLEQATYTASRDAETVARMLSGLSRAVIPLTVERSVTHVTLTLDDPIPQRFRAMIDENRGKSAAALDALQELARSSGHIANTGRLVDEIAALRGMLVDVRRDADRALSLPAARRSGDIAKLPARIVEIIDRTMAAGHFIRDARLLQSSGTVGIDLAKARAMVIREFGGRGRTHFAVAALHSAPLNSATIGDMRENHGRVMQSWNLLEPMRDQMSPKVQAAIDEVRREYFERYGEVRAAMYAAAETGRYPMDFETFFARSGTAMSSAERLVAALGEAMAETATASRDRSWYGLLSESVISIFIAAATLFLVWLLVFRISGRVDALSAQMRRLAEGDLAIDTKRLAANDEIGDMVATVEVFRANAERVQGLKAEEAEREAAARREKSIAMGALADGFERSVGAIVGAVAEAARTLETAAGGLTAAAAETDRRSGEVAGAAGSAACNVETVAAASEELAASITEIGAQVEQSSGIAGRAVREAESAGREVRALSTAAERIGSIVSLIESIAAKTNLLALNATIEAARAGDAGRGFAVVASEVKGLAEQTAKATAEIGSQIAAIQSSTQITVDAIEAIGRTIGEIDAISASVAAAVTQQGAATGEIARNVQEAHAGAQTVTSAIADVQASATGSASAAKDVLAAARGLSSQAADMRREIDGFLGTIRAA